jgi:hypothetical protein
MMTTKPLTDDERAVIRYIWSADPPATEPVPRFLTDSLRRIVQSADPIDTLRNEYRTVGDLVRRHEIERGTRDTMER